MKYTDINCSQSNKFKEQNLFQHNFPLIPYVY